jgi:LuxR family transcriptional regulator, maltose regulon positive regulatory protein
MTVTEIPFDLAEVKLDAPLTRPGSVVKADVIAQLCTENVPFATVVAPAGYGKTTLLAQWADADPRPFAWVALDGRDDDDAVVFLRYIAAALHSVEPLPSDVFSALSGPRASDWPMRVPRIGRALAGVGHPLVLVLDDLHTIANPACLDVLTALFQYVPAGSQIAVASREEPPLPLARWRSQGSVSEIGVADLRLNEVEAGLLLTAAGIELDPTEISELTDQTEGWPAGLYLAALSMQAGGPSPADAEAFKGDDRFVSEYFRLELLSRLPPADAEFLKYTSVLNRMSGSLCDSVLQTTRSADKLVQLARVNGFVVSVDRRSEWYRYHHLFGQLLRNELEHTEPDVVAELNARAMEWCIAEGLTEDAAAYGHVAGETDTVAGLVDGLALPTYYDGRMETLEEWVGWFSDDELKQYPALAVYGAWLAALTGRPDDAEGLLALADGTTSRIPLSDGSAAIKPWVAILRAHMMPNGVEQALADANIGLDQLSPDSMWIPTALLARGVAYALLGEADRAMETLGETVERGLAAGSAEEVSVAQAQLALLAAKRGAWGDARVRAEAAQAVADEVGLGDYSSIALTHVATARIALHDGRKDDARAALARTHRLRPLLDHSIPWLTIEVGFELTRAHLALAEPAVARTVFTETEHVLQLRPDMGSLAEEAQELHEQVAATSGPGGAWAMSLTGAELRLLPYLATHLTFPEIANRLFISRNTVKTEAVSAYRKLSASSRSEAVERAVEVGLLESSIYPAPENLTQEV